MAGSIELFGDPNYWDDLESPYYEIESDGEDQNTGNGQYVSNDAGPPSSEVDKGEIHQDNSLKVIRNLSIAAIAAFGITILLCVSEKQLKPTNPVSIGDMKNIIWQKTKNIIVDKIDEASNLFALIHSFYGRR